MNGKLDVGDVERAMERTVARFPQHRDERVIQGHDPRYVYHGNPWCMVAVVLDELGFGVKRLKALDKAGAYRIDQIHPLRPRFTREAWELLAWVQRRNDGGRAWDWILREAFNRTEWGHIPHPDNSFWAARPWLGGPDEAERASGSQWGRLV